MPARHSLSEEKQRSSLRVPERLTPSCYLSFIAACTCPAQLSSYSIPVALHPRQEKDPGHSSPHSSSGGDSAIVLAPEEECLDSELITT